MQKISLICQENSPRFRIADSNSIKAISFSAARTTKRVPAVAMALCHEETVQRTARGQDSRSPLVRRAGRNQQRNRICKVSQPIASRSVGICRRSTSRAAYLRTLFVRQSAANMRHITTANTRLSGRSKRSVTSSVGLFANAWMPTHNIRLSLRA